MNNNRTNSTRLLFTTTEAGERLGMATRTVDRLIRQGKIAVVRVPSSGKVGRPRNMVSAEALQNFIEDNTIIMSGAQVQEPKSRRAKRSKAGTAAAVLRETGVAR